MDTPVKRNVLLLINSFDIGGAETQILLLARLLQKGGKYNVHLATLRRSGLLLDEAESLGLGEIEEYRLTSFYDRNMIVQLRRFRSLLKKRRIDVIHTEGFYTNIFGILGAWLARVPARIAFRGETGGWRTPRQDQVEQRVCRLAGVIHANSEGVKRYLVERGVAPERIEVIYNGVELARVTPPNGLDRQQMLDRLGLPRDRPLRIISIVANMHHEVKDHRMFLRAAQRVKRAAPDAAFVMAGEGGLTDSLREYAAELGLARNAFFLGRCERVAELLAVSEICVLSSKAEGFSNAILEYMAAARPVVVTDVGGAREAVVEGETGFIVPSGDDEQMAQRITSLLLDPAGARVMGARAQDVVMRRFSDQVQLERTQDLYDRMLAQKAI